MSPLGVALAGGQSRRMGRDKARLPLPAAWGNGDLLSWTVERLAKVCPEVIVADGGRALMESYRSVSDGPGRGPAAGILGAAAAFPGRSLLVLACDLPLVPESLLHRLADAGGPDAEVSPPWTVPERDGRLEPLCALYRPAALAVLEARVLSGRLDLQGLRQEFDAGVEILGAEAWEVDDGGVSIFLNVNQPRDLDDLAAVRRACLRQGSSSR